MGNKNRGEKWTKFANEYIVSLFPVFMLVDAFIKGFQKILGRSADFICKIENHAAEYFNRPSNWHVAHLALVGKIKTNPNFLRKMYDLMEKLGKEQIKDIAIFKQGFKGKSNKTLNNYYQRYVKSNTLVYTYGLLLPLLDFQDTTFLSDELNRILKIKGREKYFEVLTTPLRSTINKSQELALLKILARIKNSKKLTAEFKTADAAALLRRLQNSDHKLFNSLKNHTVKYCWVNYVYEGPALKITDFIGIIRDFLRRGVDPIKELSSYQLESRELKIKQKKILKELKLNQYETQIVELTRAAVFIKPYRRELQSHSYYYLEFLLTEIARRLNLSLRQVRMMLSQEIAAALLQGRVNTEIINQRMNLVIYGRRGSKSFCLVGRRAEAFFKQQVAREHKIKLPENLQGTTAFSGRVTGIVRLINMPEEMNKMESGNILVATTTSPNLMPAIRQAAALVTDEGGLTCHAAIVSRELRIPCVVGTKFATKVLKDGDLVEVNANEGDVMKL
ncbi:MAG: PEP-utilizing enzyme [Candidatus Falkowbacteria bacterium]|nr:PEP-utilizing enzyme [Candidatus Falkowbacteria bacterium]